MRTLLNLAGLLVFCNCLAGCIQGPSRDLRSPEISGKVLDAATQFVSLPSQSGVRLFVIEDEHRDDTMAWSAAFRDPRLEALGYTGNGWVLWLEHGRLRDVEDCAGCPGRSADSLVARTRALWP